MNRIKPTGNQNQGQAIITALIFLTTLTFLGFGLLMVASIDSTIAENLKMGEDSLNAAEEGVIFGMAFASDSRNGFVSLDQGQMVTVSSYDPSLPADNFHFNLNRSRREMYHFTVQMTMMGQAPPPPGAAVGVSAAGGIEVFKMFRLRSTGRVNAGGGLYDPVNPPAYQRTVEVIARIRFVI
jgi:hypothetical protein